MKELVPCICGGKAIIERDRYGDWVVSCNNVECICYNNKNAYSTEAQAVEAWNKHNQIVLCRDCAKWSFFDVEGGVRYGECSEWKHPDSSCFPATRENGFCAWGERR